MQNNRYLASILTGLIVLLLAPFTTSAANIEGAVTFTFDDANASQYEYAYSILDKAGQKGVVYVPTGEIDVDEYMTYTQLKTLLDEGWEIAGHSVTHAELPEISTWKMRREIDQCYADLDKLGLEPENFATPFGAYDTKVLARIALSFNSHRGYHEIGLNKWPYNKYYLHVKPVVLSTTLEEVKGWIDEAIANDFWLILVFHEVLPVVDPTDDTSWTTANMELLMDYMNNKGIKAKTAKEVLANQNLIDGSFEGGFGKWTKSGRVYIDPFNRGAYPESKYSVRFSGSTRPAYLFGPMMSVDPNQLYGVRFFTNTQLSRGELGFYIDEYNTNGDWISGQWLGLTNHEFVIDEVYQYTPSSANVSHASIQVYLTPGSIGRAYIDEIEVFTP